MGRCRLRATAPAIGNEPAGDYYELTLGLNWTPRENIILRPELRWDWFDAPAGTPQPFDAGTSDDQFTFGIDLIVTF